MLDNLPKTVQAQAKARLHQMYLSPTRQDALGAYDDFLSLYEARYPKACSCLTYCSPFTISQPPTGDIRTTNPIESTFSTVRHRTRQTKGCGSRNATLMMVYKLPKNTGSDYTATNSLNSSSRALNFRTETSKPPRMRSPPSTTFDNISGMPV